MRHGKGAKKLLCQLLRANYQPNSAMIVENLSNADNTTEISLVQLATWNPYILGACDQLAPGQFICSRQVDKMLR